MEPTPESHSAIATQETIPWDERPLGEIREALLVASFPRSSRLRMKQRRHVRRMLAVQQSDENAVFGQRPWDSRRMFDMGERITRSEFWACLALALAVLAVSSVVQSLLASLNPWFSWLQLAVLIVGLLFPFWIFLNAIVNRAHDMGMRGRWLWLFLVPLAGAVLTIVLGSVRGQPGRNEFDLPVIKPVIPPPPIHA